MIRKILPFAVFLSVALASLFLAGYSYVTARDATDIKFAAAADDAASRIEARVDQHLSLLYATAAFFEAQEGMVDRQQFDRFVEAADLRRRFPGVRSLGFAPLILAGEEISVERRIAEGYAIERGVWPETQENWRTPVVLLAPTDEFNRAAIGFDMFSEPVRRTAILEAMRTGEARASGRVALVSAEDESSHTGFIVYLPLEAGVVPPRPQDAPQSTVKGFVYAAFRVNELFDAALGRFPLLPLDVEVRDDTDAPEAVLYRSAPQSEPVASDMDPVWREITVSGKRWPVQFRPNASFEAPLSRVIPISLGLFGLVLAGAIAYMARLQDRAYDAATRLQETAEKNLLEKDLMLQEMKHRIKNSIARVLAIARQTASNAKSLEEFSSSFGSRLQSMANSQDMLTRSRWQKADLEELLRTELEQVFGKGSSDANLRGPRVKIDESTTQALGLTFHELATNALKYGEIAGGTGSLKVEWRAEGQGRARRLVLIWTETSSRPVTPPTKAGFGTKLIDMNISRELGGEITRDYRDDGIVIRISIPLK